MFEFDATKRVKIGNTTGKPDLEFRAAAPLQAATDRPGFAKASPLEFEKYEAAASKTSISS